MNEIWKPVPGFSDYDASSLGRIRSRRSTHGIKILKPCPRRNGYIQHPVIADNGTRRTMKAHRLVALAFGIIEPHDHVNHIDGVKNNNTVSNLERSNPSHNRKHAWAIGLHKPLGSRHGLSKINEIDVGRIRLLHEYGLTYDQIGHVFGFAANSARAIITGKNWKKIGARG